MAKNPQPSPPHSEPHLFEALMDPKTTAAYLGVSILTLSDFRTKGIGPSYIKVGRCVRYRRSDVETWLTHRTKLGT